MTKSKTFPTPKALTSWRNKLPPGVTISHISSVGDKQVAYYEEDPELQDLRREALREAVERHINYDPATRSNLGYSDLIADKAVAQFSLVKNTVRNLKCFSDLSQTDKAALVVILLEELDYVTLSQVEAKDTYGVRSVLIVRKGE